MQSTQEPRKPSPLPLDFQDADVLIDAVFLETQVTGVSDLSTYIYDLRLICQACGKVHFPPQVSANFDTTWLRCRYLQNCHIGKATRFCRSSAALHHPLASRWLHCRLRSQLLAATATLRTCDKPRLSTLKLRLTLVFNRSLEHFSSLRDNNI